MLHIFINSVIRILKTPTHLKMDVVFKWHYMNRSRIGTILVVYKRAVIENQSFVRLVVAKDVIPSGLALYTVDRQK